MLGALFGKLGKTIVKHPINSAFVGFTMYETGAGLYNSLTSKEPAPVAALRGQQSLVSGALSLAAFLPGPWGFAAMGLQFAVDAAYEWEAKKRTAITAYGMGRNKFHYSPVVMNNRTVSSVNRGMARIAQTQGNWASVARGRAFSAHQRYGMSF